MTLPPSPPGARELFRYARLHPPRILDLESRLSHPELQEPEFEKPRQARDGTGNQEWAADFRQSGEFVADLKKLAPALFSLLKIDEVPEDRLPDRSCIRNRRRYEAFLRRESEALGEATRRITLSMFAAALDGDREVAQRLARTIQFLELLPDVPNVERRGAYAPAVLKRYRDRSAKKDPPVVEAWSPGTEDHASRSSSEVRSSQILALWDLSNAYVRWKKRSLEERIRAVRETTFHFEAPKLTKKSEEARKEALGKARSEQYSAYIKDKKARLGALQAELRALREQSPQEHLGEAARDEEFKAVAERKYGGETSALLANPDIPLGTEGFSGRFVSERERETGVASASSKCVTDGGNPCLEVVGQDRTVVAGRDDVRPLGVAELITVEENWLGYTPGEISAIESVLKGERRRKRVKSTKYFEELTESLAQESVDQESETQSTVRQDLSSQIESEIATRFNSDVNASMSGSGGGTIGVVTLQGGASLGAGIGLGVDTRLSSRSGSEFAQEIVSKAVERTRRVASDLRRTRSTQTFEISNLHEIDNTGDGAAHSNAVYCFLDKRICITERVYGIRKFLGAELLRPGADLVKKERQKHILNLNDLGIPPTFDLTPADITPSNYLTLVGRYRAANVSPPPPEIKLVTRTYKTDITNENQQGSDLSIEKIADVLAPFFGEYKRFLIQDTIEIPEGYRIQEVRVTVTHGSNGVSIPAHLPFSLVGAMIFALPTIGVASIPPYTFYYLPLALWQVLYAASPFLHYNADSSNVTLNIGHETEESPYFFFQPDHLITEVVDALSSSSIVSEDFVEFLQQKLEELATSFTASGQGSVTAALTGMSQETLDAINNFISELQNWLRNLVTQVIPNMIAEGGGAGPTFPPIPMLDPDTVAAIPQAIMTPFRTFFDDILAHVEGLVHGALGDALQYLLSVGDNTDTFGFSGSKGFVDSLPVSFNCIALKPGVTLNLSAFLVRTEQQALDAWRLETFDRLNQAYYQLLADYDARRQMAGQQPVRRGSPGLMRGEERDVIKSRVIRALRHKYGSSTGTAPTLDELRLFEHAIDWENVSFRLFTYGPSGLEVAYEKLGFFDSADERRKRFLNAAWAQVLIPLRDDGRLEQVLIRYLETGTVDFEADLLTAIEEAGGEPLNELTEIYRDLVLQREQLPEIEPERREETIPTELMVIYEPTDGEFYPVNPDGCRPPQG